MMSEVEIAFERTSVGMERWADPHPDRIVADEEYERITNPAKWRIVGARVDAWLDVLVGGGFAQRERDREIDWSDHSSQPGGRTDLIVPVVADGVVLAVRRTRFGDDEGADGGGVQIGVRHRDGGEASELALVPDCGCDACDSGSQDVIDEVDATISPVVTGEIRVLWHRRQQIVVIDGQLRSARNVDVGRGAERRPDRPPGWSEVTGPSWLAGVPWARQQ